MIYYREKLISKTKKSPFAILGMLALLKKSSGYDLKKHMESSTQYFWKETFSSIYPILEDLEKQKLIEKVDTPAKNDRKRNVYTLTSEGNKTFEHWLMQAPETLQLRNELLLKIFFGTKTSIDVSIKHIEKFQHELENKLSFFREVERRLRHTDSLESMYSLITLNHGIKQTSSALEWCKDSIEKLNLAKNKDFE